MTEDTGSHEKLDTLKTNVPNAIMPTKQFLLRLREVHVVCMNCADGGIQGGYGNFGQTVIIRDCARKVSVGVNLSCDWLVSGIIRDTSKSNVRRFLDDVLIRIRLQ